MKAIYRKRLLKLAAHLRSNQLAHKRFDFACINADEWGIELTTNGCGTVGCAIGECPAVFPKYWEWRDGTTILKKMDLPHPRDAFVRGAEEFFGLNRDERQHLFEPDNQWPEQYGGRHLGETATAKQVARNIEIFVRRKEKESK